MQVIPQKHILTEPLIVFKAMLEKDGKFYGAFRGVEYKPDTLYCQNISLELNNEIKLAFFFYQLYRQAQFCIGQIKNGRVGMIEIPAGAEVYYTGNGELATNKFYLRYIIKPKPLSN